MRLVEKELMAFYSSPLAQHHSHKFLRISKTYRVLNHVCDYVARTFLVIRLAPCHGMSHTSLAFLLTFLPPRLG